FRRVDIFSRVSRVPDDDVGTATLAGAVGVRGAACVSGTGVDGATMPSPRGLLAVAVCSITSGLLTTPPRPVPAMVAISTPSSAATRLAAGDAFTSARDRVGGDEGGVDGGASAGAAVGARAGPA